MIHLASSCMYETRLHINHGGCWVQNASLELFWWSGSCLYFLQKVYSMLYRPCGLVEHPATAVQMPRPTRLCRPHCQGAQSTHLS